MIAAILSMMGGFCTWLSTVLPISPFAGVSLALGNMSSAVGWLNWVIPVGQMAQLLAAWLAAAIVWQVVSYVMGRSSAVLSLFGK